MCIPSSRRTTTTGGTEEEAEMSGEEAEELKLSYIYP
jgi:hypothetical protein